MNNASQHVGSTLDAFLNEEGILEETRAIAVAEAVAWQTKPITSNAPIPKTEK